MDAPLPQSLAAPPAAQGSAPEHRRVSEVLRDILEGTQGDRIRIGTVMDAFGERAFGFMLILFSLPNCVPMPPGVAAIVGWPVLLFGLQMILGHKRPWLPQRILDQGFSVSAFRRIVEIAEPRLRRVEAFCKPRQVWLFGPRGDRLIGLFALLVALCVLIPFPGTNFPPSIGLVIVSIAVMEEDGILLGIGLAIGAAGILYTGAVMGTAFHLATLAVQRLFGF